MKVKYIYPIAQHRHSRQTSHCCNYTNQLLSMQFVKIRSSFVKIRILTNTARPTLLLCCRLCRLAIGKFLFGGRAHTVNHYIKIKTGI